MPKSSATVLPRVGALVEGPGAYPHLSGRANLALFDAAAGPRVRRADRRARIAEVLEQVGLDPDDRRPTKAYSLGMKQRLGLAAALVRRPPLLVLDEPTNGLDPQGIRDIRELLLGLNRAGHDDLPLQPPPGRDRADVHPRRRARPRPPRAAGGHGRTSARSRGSSACAPPTSAPPSRCSTAGSSSAGPARSSYAPTTPPSSTPDSSQPACVSPGSNRCAAPSSRSCWKRPRHDPGRGAQADPAATDVGDHRRPQRPADPGRDPARGDRPRPAPGHRPALPLRRPHRRHAVPAGGPRHRAPPVPARRRGGRRRGLDRRRGAERHPSLPAGAAGLPAPRC